MSRDWVLEMKADGSNPSITVLELGLKDARSGGVFSFVPPCRSLEEFQNEINRAKVELDGMLADAQQRLESGLEGSVSGQGVVPEEAWKKMESMPSEEEMFGYFNSLSMSDREIVADYIFSHANMFKGRGPIFSQHYDSSSHLLD
jgi:hypothetical protein